MKKVMFLILAVCLMLTGCGRNIIPAADKPAFETPDVTAKINELKTASSYSEVFKQISSYFDSRRDNEKYAADAVEEETMEWLRRLPKPPRRSLRK